MKPSPYALTFDGRQSLARNTMAALAAIVGSWLLLGSPAGTQPATDAKPPVQGDLLDATPKPTPAGGKLAPASGGNAPFPQKPGLPAKVIEIPENKEIAKVTHEGKEYQQVNFGTLASYSYRLPAADEIKDPNAGLPEKYRNQLPKPVTELGGKDVAVAGFMVPLEIEKGKVKSFVLVRNQMLCCYGQTPQLNEWIHVKMEGDARAPYISDIPMTAYGKFEVGEQMYKGSVLSIYRMNATAVALPKEL